MKNCKRLTRRQMEFLEKKKLNASNWWLIKNTPTQMEILHKTTRRVKILRK